MLSSVLAFSLAACASARVSPAAPDDLPRAERPLGLKAGLVVSVREGEKVSDPEGYARRFAEALRHSGIFSEVQYPAADPDLLVEAAFIGVERKSKAKIVAGAFAIALTMGLALPLVTFRQENLASGEVTLKDRTGTLLARHQRDQRAQASYKLFGAGKIGDEPALSASDNLLAQLIADLLSDRPVLAALEKEALPAQGARGRPWRDAAPSALTAKALFSAAQARRYATIYGGPR